MEKSEFQVLLIHSSKLACEFAKNYLLEYLPNDFRYTIQLNISFDNPMLKQFDIYPDDNEKIVELATEIETVDLLFRNGKVPVWINICVDTISENCTVLKLLCAGRYSNDNNEFYYLKNGTGPFGIKSPNLPANYIEGVKFNLPVKTKSLKYKYCDLYYNM